ncbi:MAG: 4-oxalocrotonate tautomerase family protein [Campylobacter sp.]|nr:4-oxalocrotonate tautomerase family protein [Campylobacter sp.]
MPFVNIKTAAPEPSDEQKAQIIAEVSDTLSRILGKDKANILIMIETLDTASVGRNGISLKSKEKK